MEAVYAYVNHGRWVADCECAGAELVRDGDDFFCRSCGNAEAEGEPRPIEWPASRAEIEAVLALRPGLNRNWRPGETVAGLLRENEEHGL